MNKSEIGIEELRERLATQAMGWTFEPSDDPGTWPNYFVGSEAPTALDYFHLFVNWNRTEFRIGVDRWKPDTCRNQTALLLEKVAVMGLEQKLLEGLWKFKGEPLYSRANVWAAITAPPETICRAILEVMSQEQNQ